MRASSRYMFLIAQVTTRILLANDQPMKSHEGEGFFFLCLPAFVDLILHLFF